MSDRELYTIIFGAKIEVLAESEEEAEELGWHDVITDTDRIKLIKVIKGEVEG